MRRNMKQIFQLFKLYRKSLIFIINNDFCFEASLSFFNFLHDGNFIEIYWRILKNCVFSTRNRFFLFHRTTSKYSGMNNNHQSWNHDSYHTFAVFPQQHLISTVGGALGVCGSASSRLIGTWLSPCNSIS